MKILIKQARVVYCQVRCYRGRGQWQKHFNPIMEQIISIICSLKKGSSKKQLLKESALAVTDSMIVLEEFERFEEEFPLNKLSARDRVE